MQQELAYLGFVISKEGMKIEPKKVKAIVEWPIEAYARWASFDGLVNFTRKFIINFSGVCPQWQIVQRKSFTRKSSADFTWIQQGVSTSSSLWCKWNGIEPIKKLYGCRSEKLNDVRKYSVYNQQFYAIVHTLKKWWHYLLSKKLFYILIIRQ